MPAAKKISEQSVLVRLTELYTESVSTDRAKPFGGAAGQPGDFNTLGTAIVQSKLLIGERVGGAKNRTYKWFDHEKPPSLDMARKVLSAYHDLKKKHNGNIPPRSANRSRGGGESDLEALLVIVNQRLERIEAKIDAIGAIWSDGK